MVNKMVTFFGMLAIGIVACMPLVFNILVNKQFAEAYGLVPLYMIAIFFNVIIGMVSAIYLVENETSVIAVSTMAAAFINVVVDLALVKFIGVYAAPVSSIAGYASISIWRFIDINKRHCTVTIEKKNLMMLCTALVLSLISFYMRNLLVSFMILLVVAVMAVVSNKEFLTEITEIILSSIKHKSE